MNAPTLACRLLSLLGTFVLTTAVPVLAATFTVNSTLDMKDADPFDGLCLTATSVCTLRAAVQQANATPGPDTITVPAGVYTLILNVSADVANGVDPDFGDLDVTGPVTIMGAGATTTIIQGGIDLATSVDRVFDLTVPPGGLVAISGVTIRHGDAGFDHAFWEDCGGGGISNRGINGAGPGNVKLTDSIVTKNTAHHGGGLCNHEGGTMTVLRTSVTGNVAFANCQNVGCPSDSDGGGIMSKGPLIIRDSTISGNEAQEGNGGGIYVQDAGLEITNSTISGNSAATWAGGVYVASNATADLRNVTITGNTAGEYAGGIVALESAVVSTKHTVIAGNTAAQVPITFHVNDCFNLTSLGFNVIGIGETAEGPFCFKQSSPFDQVGTDTTPLDAKLGPLAYNGGSTQTHALLAGSPAIDMGHFLGCTDKSNAPLATDQRGAVRPVNTFCDIGAYEAQQTLGGAMASAQASTGAGQVTFATSAGTFGSLDAISEADLPTEGKPGAPTTFPFGLFSWTVTGLSLGDTIVVSITFPSPVAAPAAYWKVIGDSWMNLPAPQVGDNDGDNLLTLTITDGGIGDADGIVNGQISDPGGAAPSPASVNVPFAGFAALLTLKHHKAELTALFKLGGASNGIAPLTEDVTLTIGAFSRTIPAGSFHVDKWGLFKFEGVTGGVEMQVVIARLGGGLFAIHAEMTGASLAGTGNSAPVSLTIGDDSGTTAARVLKHKTSNR